MMCDGIIHLVHHILTNTAYLVVTDYSEATLKVDELALSRHINSRIVKSGGNFSSDHAQTLPAVWYSQSQSYNSSTSHIIFRTEKIEQGKCGSIVNRKEEPFPVLTTP